MEESSVIVKGGLSWKFSVVLLALMKLSEFGRGQDNDGLGPPHLCMDTGTYTNNSVYRANLDAAFSALSANMTEYGFYNTSVGQGEEIANAMALCRADVRIAECRRCVKKAAIELVPLCPNKKQAIRWYDKCMLHYSNLPITGSLTSGGDTGRRNGGTVRNPAQFREDADALVKLLRTKAANGSSVLKAGAGSRNTSDSETIYALLQCIPSLSRKDCDNCLLKVSQGGASSDSGRTALISGCNLRYDVDLFYNETRLRELNVLVLQMPNSPPGKTNDNNRAKKEDHAPKFVIIIVVLGVVCLILGALAAIILIKRKKRIVEDTPEQAMEEMITSESLHYDFRRIRAATNGFADANKLGQGGFGAVYRGELSDGQEIAVKRLSSGSGQGDKEFKNEVLLLAGLQHRNLVRLLGFSMEAREKLLVYEFVPNASLDRFLFDPIKSSQLDWQMRYKIIVGIARGLFYLHEGSRCMIIHRDLKPSNILLDENMNPKIADFGMARLFSGDETQGKTTKIVGTYGYMPPEYAVYGQFSVKTDVFSFGVLVLEIISGKKSVKNNGETVENLLSFVWKNWQEGTPENMIDYHALRTGRHCFHEILRCIHIGLWCVQGSASGRPTMSSVVLVLSSSTVTLPAASQPAFGVSSRFGSGIPEYDSKASNSSKDSRPKTDASVASSQNEISVTDLHPR